MKTVVRAQVSASRPIPCFFFIFCSLSPFCFRSDCNFCNVALLNCWWLVYLEYIFSLLLLTLITAIAECFVFSFYYYFFSVISSFLFIVAFSFPPAIVVNPSTRKQRKQNKNEQKQNICTGTTYWCRRPSLERDMGVWGVWRVSALECDAIALIVSVLLIEKMLTQQ